MSLDANKYVMYATKRCIHCGKGSLIGVKEQDILNYLSGQLAQDAFPDMPMQLREQIISGTHPDCWKEMFPDYDEDLAYESSKEV